MIKIFLVVNMFSGIWFYFNKIEYSNAMKTEAADFYRTHYYSEAAGLYNDLLNTYDPSSEHIKVNLAHAYFKAQSYSMAIKYYTELLVASDVHIRSMAQCQLGVIQHRTKKYKLALFYFKEALRTDPDNRTAAFNYELLKLKLRKEESEDKKKPGGKGTNRQNSGLNNDNTSDHNKYDIDGDKDAELFQNALYQQQNLSKQRAEKILEYLQEQEVQYYHQIQKHVPKDSRKPDW